MRNALPRRTRLLPAVLVVGLCIAACSSTVVPSVSATASSPTPSPTPDRSAPTIVARDPAPNGMLATDGRVRVTFSEPVRDLDPASFQVADAAGKVLAASLDVDPSRTAATLTPAGLVIGSTYTVPLTGLVHDDAGNALAPVAWTLHTANQVEFAAGSYTGYQFGASAADLLGMHVGTVETLLTATATEYRVVSGTGYLAVADGPWQGYWVPGTPGGTALANVAAAVPPLPTCAYEDLDAVRTDYGEWGRTVLDTVFQLPRSYVPPDLVDTSRAGLNAGSYVRAISLADLTAMVAAAEADGARLAVQSAYRSYLGQVLTYDDWVRQVGTRQALLTSARPGHSEHQLGTAIDFRAVGGASPWTYADWATTREGSWLAANAWRFGWVMSYPRGTTAVSCYRYEPWHYRYVGRETAAAVHAAGVTLREWLWAMGYGVR